MLELISSINSVDRRNQFLFQNVIPAKAGIPSNKTLRPITNLLSKNYSNKKTKFLSRTHFTISIPEKERLFILKLLTAFKFVKITPLASDQISEEEKDLVRGILYHTREEDYLTLEEAKKEIEKEIEPRTSRII
jgi:hypothetical protein